MLEQFVPEGMHPMEGIHVGVVPEELQPIGRTRVGESHWGSLPQECPHNGERKEQEEEGLPETKHDELTATRISHFPVLSGEGSRENCE